VIRGEEGVTFSGWLKPRKTSGSPSTTAGRWHATLVPVTVSVDIPTDLEARLRDEAARAGLSPEDYIRRLIERHLPSAGAARQTLDLLAQWEAEDATNDPAELERRRREAEEFMEGMNRNRLESEGPAARTAYP